MVAIISLFESDTSQAIATRFAAEGASIVGICGSVDRVRDAIASIEGSGGKAFAIEANPRDRAGAQAVVDAAVERYGRVDILINSGNSRRIIGTIFELT